MSNVEIENENTFRLALREGINLFLGAGFSVLAWNSDNKPMPLGSQLKEEIVRLFGMSSVASLTLDQICAILETTQRDSLRQFLLTRFSVDRYDPRYRLLDRLSLRSLFTTNVDNLLHKIFIHSTRYYLNDITQRGPVVNDRLGIDFVPLHGSIANDRDRLTFGVLDIATAFQRDPDMWHLLTSKLQQGPTLFWGHSIADAGVLQALSPAAIKGRTHRPKWIMLNESDSATEQYFKALGFNLIVSDTSGILGYIESSSLGPVARAAGRMRPTSELFPTECVPTLGEVVARPLLNFYLGGAPDWYNIFNDRIYKTNHYDKLIEAIHAGKNVAVIGIPACGKSTLLMQLAAGLVYDGHKLVTEYTSADKIRLIINRLDGENAVVFIDNFASDVEAFLVACQASNVQVVGFDREHNFDMISHRLGKNEISVVDVTGLTQRDVQEIFDRIPQNIRSLALRRPVTEEGVPPSLIEFIDSNITVPGITERFRSVLEELERSDEIQHDILVMTAYVHACQSAVSIDMVRSFLDDRFESYQALYERMDRLGRLIATVNSSALVDTDQDHFVARSTIVSEAIVREVSSRGFKRVLLQFHGRVSSYRICRYDVFKRHGFDERFATRAFPDWREGQEFYEKLKVKDSSPYLGQQCALYLAHRGRFAEAFKWIDEALLESGSRIPSIRHSHAIILFNANFRLAQAGDLDARVFLDQSMQILEECYAYDKRKTFHALTFGDQALKYYQVFSDDKALSYLSNAKAWLADEQRRVPWNRNVRRVFQRVSRWV